jgi:hypothetical protein
MMRLAAELVARSPHALEDNLVRGLTATVRSSEAAKVPMRENPNPVRKIWLFMLS